MPGSRRTTPRRTSPSATIPTGVRAVTLTVARRQAGDQPGAPNRSTRSPKEYIWGYGTAASATDPRYGDIVLSEWTQPFNEQDARTITRCISSDRHPWATRHQRGRRLLPSMPWPVSNPDCAPSLVGSLHPTQPARSGATRCRPTARPLCPGKSDALPRLPGSPRGTATRVQRQRLPLLFPTPQPANPATIPTFAPALVHKATTPNLAA